MRKNSIYPLVTSYGFREKSGGITFILPGRKVTVEGPNELLRLLLKECDGYKSLEEVISSVISQGEYQEDEVEEVIQAFLEHQILVDAHEYYQLFHLASGHPIMFLRDHTEDELVAMLKVPSFLVQPPQVKQTLLENLLERRESTRKFSGEPLTKEEILRLGWATYGKISRSSKFPESTIGVGTVPSAGALYPLKLFVIMVNATSSLKKGIYRLGPEGISFIAHFEFEKITQIIRGNDIQLEKAGVIIVIVCNFQQTTQKYSNSGYRYALLEAGHAAQNAYLWCTEQDLGIVEVGGFDDEELARMLRLSYPKQAPLTVLVIGRKVL